MGVKRFKLTSTPWSSAKGVKITGSTLANDRLTATVDPASGAVKSLHFSGIDQDLVDPTAPVGLNDFRYVLGTDAKGAKSNDVVTLSAVDNGPLVATLRIQSKAPGCSNLIREVRLVDQMDRLELFNFVDRQSVRVKDSVHFGFGFNVPKGTVRMETPWAVVRPNTDQLQGSCYNWYTVQRWVDISNPSFGITWASLDAPLMQIGGITANLLGSVAFNEWMTNAIDSQTLYSWAQNNHWHTNYKIDQPGVTVFRYILRPHLGNYSSAESSRYGMETTRPLLVGAADSAKPALNSLFTVSNPDVLVESVQWTTDSKAIIVRLFGVSGKGQTVKLNWNTVKPKSVLGDRPH